MENKSVKRLLIMSKILFSSAFLIGYFLEKKKPEREYSNNFNHDLFNLSAGIADKAVMSLITASTYSAFDSAERKSFGLLNSTRLPENLRVIPALILIDLWMYIWHRMNHQFSFLWKFHQFHHEDLMVNSTSAVRFHSGEIIISTLLRILVFVPLGISKKHISIYEKIFFPVIFFHHSNIKITEKFDLLYRKLAVSPEMHRTHHSKFIKEANSNYGSVLPYWDIIFGTYTKFPGKKVEFGIGEK